MLFLNVLQTHLQIRNSKFIKWGLFLFFSVSALLRVASRPGGRWPCRLPSTSVYRCRYFVVRVPHHSFILLWVSSNTVSPRLVPRSAKYHFFQLTSVTFLLFQAWQVAPARAGHLTSARDAPEDSAAFIDLCIRRLVVFCSSASSMFFVVPFVDHSCRPRRRNVPLRLTTRLLPSAHLRCFVSSSLPHRCCHHTTPPFLPTAHSPPPSDCA